MVWSPSLSKKVENRTLAVWLVLGFVLSFGLYFYFYYLAKQMDPFSFWKGSTTTPSAFTGGQILAATTARLRAPRYAVLGPDTVVLYDDVLACNAVVESLSPLVHAVWGCVMVSPNTNRRFNDSYQNPRESMVVKSSTLTHESILEVHDMFGLLSGSRCAR